jgi:integrase
VAVLYRSGLRVREALALDVKDIDLDACAVRVLRGKGGRSRTVGIDRSGAAAVQEWLRLRRRLGAPARGPVFLSIRGGAVAGPMTTAYARVLLPRLGRQAGIAKRVHPHGLRHTLAVELREEGVDIAIISKQLGHRSVSTTARYLDHIAPLAVIEAMRSRDGGPLSRI